MVPSSATKLLALSSAITASWRPDDEEPSADLTTKIISSGKSSLLAATLAPISLMLPLESKRSVLSTLWAKRSVNSNARMARTFSQAAPALEASLLSALARNGTIAFAAGTPANSAR